MNFERSIRSFAGQPIPKEIIFDLLKEYKRPYDKINELVKQGLLMPLKRGIYLPGTVLNIERPEPFLLANHLLGPSYVSLESALSFWGLIPEKVFEISSVTVKNSKNFKTTVGRFSYTHLPLPYYSFGIQQVKLASKQYALVASPEKALCDKIITTSNLFIRSIKQGIALLLEDFRIDEQMLRNLNKAEIARWVTDAPKKASLSMLIKSLEQV